MKKNNKNNDKDDADGLPFPNSRVVDLIRSRTKKKILKKRLKVAMNKLLGNICLKISDKLAAMPYSSLDYEDFAKAAKPYLKLGLSQQERRKIAATLDKITQDAKMMSMELKEELEED